MYLTTRLFTEGRCLHRSSSSINNSLRLSQILGERSGSIWIIAGINPTVALFPMRTEARELGGEPPSVCCTCGEGHDRHFALLADPPYAYGTRCIVRVVHEDNSLHAGYIAIRNIDRIRYSTYGFLNRSNMTATMCRAGGR